MDSVKESLDEYFEGDIKKTLQSLKDDPSNQLWMNLNDNLRIAISEVPHANLVLGKNNIKQALLHEPANGLNDLVKSYVNACLLLIQSDNETEEEERKEDIDLPFDVDKILPRGISNISENDLMRELALIGFKKENGNKHIHFKFYVDQKLIGVMNFPYGNTRRKDMRKRTIAGHRRNLFTIAQKAIE